jgi:hypothetical protein
VTQVALDQIDGGAQVLLGFAGLMSLKMSSCPTKMEIRPTITITVMSSTSVNPWRLRSTD